MAVQQNLNGIMCRVHLPYGHVLCNALKLTLSFAINWKIFIVGDGFGFLD